MREHLRIDTFKVFPEDSKALSLVMEDNKTKNKSEGYRIALQTYSENRKTVQALQAVTDELTSTRKDLADLRGLVEDLYFVIRNQGVKV